MSVPMDTGAVRGIVQQMNNMRPGDAARDQRTPHTHHAQVAHPLLDMVARSTVLIHGAPDPVILRDSATLVVAQSMSGICLRLRWDLKIRLTSDSNLRTYTTDSTRWNGSNAYMRHRLLMQTRRFQKIEPQSTRWTRTSVHTRSSLRRHIRSLTNTWLRRILNYTTRYAR